MIILYIIIYLPIAHEIHSPATNGTLADPQWPSHIFQPWSWLAAGKRCSAQGLSPGGTVGEIRPLLSPRWVLQNKSGFSETIFTGQSNVKHIPNLGDHAVCLGSYVTLLIRTGCSWLYHTLLTRSSGAQWGCSQGRTTPESPERDRTKRGQQSQIWNILGKL